MISLGKLTQDGTALAHDLSSKLHIGLELRIVWRQFKPVGHLGHKQLIAFRNPQPGCDVLR